jgi:hypothetical protein
MALTTDSYRKNILAGYCIIFYVLMVYKWFNGMFLYQMNPYFFYTREDLFTWLFMQTGLHQILLDHKPGLAMMDLLFYAAPLLWYVADAKLNKAKSLIAILVLAINWTYVQCYTLYPTNSIEAHVAWLLFPVAFIAQKEKTFELLFGGLRYFFLFFFASAGIWKLALGGIFNTHQMSNILLYQHKELLLTTPQHWYAEVIGWLINHHLISYMLYLAATAIEIVFILGFFTKRFDTWLILAFIAFLFFDHFVMRIPYYEVTPLLLTLIFNKKNEHNIA